MTKKSEQTIRTAWSELVYIADTWDITAPHMLRDAEKAEARDFKHENYPRVQQLAGLCETALDLRVDVASLYGLREGHVKVAIFAAAAAERQLAQYAAWVDKYGEAIREFRRDAIAAR